MWRVVLAASLLLTLAFGAVAEAKCQACLESVKVETESGSTLLRFTARTYDPASFPETGTAVVMQFDGNRGKCLTVSLVRTGITTDPNASPGLPSAIATYVGRFNFIYQNASVLAGRADLEGSIYDFTVPLDGTPGKITISSYQGSINGANAPTIITPQPVTITPDPATVDPRTAEQQRAAVATAAQRGAPAPATPTLIDSLAGNTIGLMGLIVVVVAIVSAYLDRKRSLARAAATG